MTVSTAKHLRKNPTEAEKKLWTLLRNRRIAGLKFRRQVSLGAYVADFVCYEAKLIIEVDGGQHDFQKSKDSQRSEWFKGEGYQLIRFWNNDVLENPEGVIQTILMKLGNPSP